MQCPKCGEEEMVVILQPRPFSHLGEIVCPKCGAHYLFRDGELIRKI